MLPLFPLNIVIFPGEELALKVIEDRYRILIEDCCDQNNSLGVVYCDDYADEKGTMSNIGCKAEIVSTELLEDNSLGVVLKGEERFVADSIKEKDELFYANKTKSLDDKVDLKENDPVLKSARSSLDEYLDILADIDPTMVKGGIGAVIKPEDSFKVIDQIILPEDRRQQALELSIC